MRYVVDTNIISEIFKPRPNDKTIDWMQDHVGSIYLTTITLLELYYGALRLPEGKRRRTLYEHIKVIAQDCKDNTFDFDSFSAYLCAEMRVKAQAAGRTPQIADLMIAAICKRHNAVLATHNTKDFDYLGIELIDPFDYESQTLKRLRREEQEREALGVPR